MADSSNMERWRRSPSAAAAAAAASNDGEGSVDDSTSMRSTASKRRLMAKVNLSNPQPSYAYGAPPDVSTRNDKILGRQSHGPSHGRSELVMSAGSVSGGASATGDPTRGDQQQQQRAPSEDRNALPGAVRYAKLRAQRDQATALTDEARQRQSQARQQRQNRQARIASPSVPPQRRDAPIAERNEDDDDDDNDDDGDDDDQAEETRHSQRGTPQPRATSRGASMLPPSLRQEGIRSFHLRPPAGGYTTAADQQRLHSPGAASNSGYLSGSYDYVTEGYEAQQALMADSSAMSPTRPADRRAPAPTLAPVPAPASAPAPVRQSSAQPARSKKRTSQRDPAFRPSQEGSSDTDPEDTGLMADDRAAIEEVSASLRGSGRTSASLRGTGRTTRGRARTSQDDTTFRPDAREEEGSDDSEERKRTSRRTSNKRASTSQSQSQAKQTQQAKQAQQAAASARPSSSQQRASGPTTSNVPARAPVQVPKLPVFPLRRTTPPAPPAAQPHVDEDQGPLDNDDDALEYDKDDEPDEPARAEALRVPRRFPLLLHRAPKWIAMFALGVIVALIVPMLWNAFAPKRGIYVPPGTKPRDLDGLADRLWKLERAVGSLSSDHGAELSKLKSDFAQARTELYDRLDKVEQRTHEGQKMIDMLELKAADLRKLVVQLAHKLTAKEREIESKLDALTRQLKATNESTTSSSAITIKLQSRIAQLETQLEQTKSDLSSLERAHTEAQTQHSKVLERLDDLEKVLPAQIIVKRNTRTGALEVDPSFWVEFRKHVASGTSEEDLRKHVRQETQAILNDPSRLTDTQLVSRSDFAGMVRGELSLLQAEMEARLEDRFTGRLSDVQADMFDRVRRSAQAYSKAGSLDRTSARYIDRLLRPGTAVTDAPPPPPSPATDVPPMEGNKAVLDMIDAALERYSADKLARPDYALYTTGGRVIPSLTSPSYNPSSNSWLSNLARTMSPIPLGTVSVIPRAPVVALHPDVTPGMCWAFGGSEGQLGVALFKHVVVTDITIEHVARSVVPDAEAAPREVQVWGLISTWEDMDKVVAYRKQRAQAGTPDDDWDTPMPTPPSSEYMYLGTYTYDASAHARSIQTFPVPAAVQALRVPTSVLRFRFVSNHGKEDYTCVYRVRVHGEEPQPAPPA